MQFAVFLMLCYLFIWIDSDAPVRIPGGCLGSLEGVSANRIGLYYAKSISGGSQYWNHTKHKVLYGLYYAKSA